MSTTTRTAFADAGASLANRAGPLRALAGRSRRAAWWRRIARRSLSIALVALCLGLLLSQRNTSNGVSQPANGSPGGDTTEPNESAQVSAAPDGVDASPGGAAGGARLVPTGFVGLSVPALDAQAVATLRPGDHVDVYATGNRKPVARDARILAVTTGSLGSGDQLSDVPLPTASAEPSVFLAVDPAEVGGITASLPAQAPPQGFWFAVHPN